MGTSVFDKKNERSSVFRQALRGSIVKLDPRVMIKNPVMFVVEIGFFLTCLMCIYPSVFGDTAVGRGYIVFVSVILLVTLLFANFAEAYAEGRGKAQANTLRKTRATTEARCVLPDGNFQWVSAATLKAGDIVRVEKEETIPSDGDVLEGIAAVDESAITGESAFVIKEPGTEGEGRVTGGTRIMSDWLVIRVTVNAGESFLDKMVALVEGAKRQKTPNEMALTVLLASLTLIFLVVCATLLAYAAYAGYPLDLATVIALLVCLIPTTIGALLSAIGIAGMDRVSRFNIIAMSGRAVEACGDIGVMILDKTGTITLGNRMASAFLPLEGTSVHQLAKMSAHASFSDMTPEGKSIVGLAEKEAVALLSEDLVGEVIPFSAETRSSGIDMRDGTQIRKGAMDAIKHWVLDQGGTWPAQAQTLAESVAHQGGTPLVVSVGSRVLGVIHLKDIVKPGLKARFEKMRVMGIRTVMCTGDNPITAQVIASEAGIDDHIAQAKPEDKILIIKKYQSEGHLVAMTGDGTNDAPALAQADVGLAMNSGTQAAKEAANMIDLDSDPTKLLDVIAIGKQLLITRGALTTFSVTNDVAKYFAIIPAICAFGNPAMQQLDVMRLGSPENAILSALIFNAVIIPMLIPLALRGVRFTPMTAESILARNLLFFGVGGVLAPFVGIKLISLVLQACGL